MVTLPTAVMTLDDDLEVGETDLYRAFNVWKVII